MTKIAVIILAAGRSSRMGSIKQLLKINDKTLLDISIDAAKKSNADAVFCVLGANKKLIKKELINQEIKFIINNNFNEGLGSSIVAGVEYLEKLEIKYDAVLVMLADQPEVDSEYLNSLIKTYNENLTKIITSSYGSKSGVPAIFPQKYFNKLKNLKGDKGAKEFLENHATKTIKMKRKKPFRDLDTQEEYKSYLNIHL